MRRRGEEETRSLSNLSGVAWRRATLPGLAADGPFFSARAGVIVDNDDMSTGMEKKEIVNSPDIFWSREPIMGPKGTKENPAIIPSFNSSRCVGLETEQARPPQPARHRRASPRGD